MGWALAAQARKEGALRTFRRQNGLLGRQAAAGFAGFAGRRTRRCSIYGRQHAKHARVADICFRCRVHPIERRCTQLFGMNISYIPSINKLRNCIPDALLLHYQRDPGLLRRRVGTSGPWPTIIFAAKGGRKGTFASSSTNMPCSASASSVQRARRLRASREQDWGNIGTGYLGACKEGLSALEHNQQCFYNGTPTVTSIVEEACLGKSACKVLNDVRTKTRGHLAVSNPCKGQCKRILAAARCSG